MLTYIIDGNNLMGKIPSFMSLQKKEKQASREKLVFILDRYFANRKNKATLHFDGHPNTGINSSKMRIVYSENQTADEKIKEQISKSKSPRNLIIVTSDANLAQFAKVCSCRVVTSDGFAAEIKKVDSEDDEQAKINSINNLAEFKKLFGV